MPTYEFRCPTGHSFDQFHRISDAPSTAKCPTCGEDATRAISGGAGLVFKGSGFYLTDYGKNAHRSSGSAPAKGDASPGGESKGGESKGGESKAGEAKGGDGGGSGGSTSGGGGGSGSSGSTGTGGSSSGGSSSSGSSSSGSGSAPKGDA